MDNEKWYQLSIKTNPEISDSITDYLFEYGLEGIFLDKENIDKLSNQIKITAFFTEGFLNKDNLENILKSEFTHLKQDDISIQEVNTTDWVSDSQKHFEVFHVGKNLVFKPIWQDYKDKEEEIVIDFDPGSFFGSIPHPSTRLCLEEIENISTSLNKDANILDLGVGSGILSLALYHLGFKKITAIDIDPVAIRSSEDNFSLNKMNVKLFLGEIKDCDDKYDFIAGNLLAQTITELAEQISEKLNDKGIFIAAGITRKQEVKIIDDLKQVNLIVSSKKYSDDWVLIRAIKEN